MHLNLDLGDLHRMHAQAIKQLRAVPSQMLKVGQYWAAYERMTHAYQNRTGNLQRSTFATISKSDAECTLYLRMDMFYASYVDNLGYSNIDEAARNCRAQIGAVMEQCGRGIR